MKLTLLVLTLAVAYAQPPADLIVRNGKIATMEPSQPIVQAVAIGNGVILGLGTNAQVGRFIGVTFVFTLSSFLWISLCPLCLCG